MTEPAAHFELEEIAPGVHAAIARRDGWGLCNAAIVDLGGFTLVFDAMLTPQAGTALGRAAARLTGRPVDLLVNSHRHGDHVRGNSAVGAVRIASTHAVRTLVAERAGADLASDRAEAPAELARLRAAGSAIGSAEREVLVAWFEGILATPPEWTIRPPDLTFAHELTVHGHRRSARLLSFGGGHSASDVFVELPEDRVVLMGDLVSSGFHPSLWDGDPTAFRRILRQVGERPIDRLLPGHGPVSGRASLPAMDGYLAALEVLADARNAEGRPPESAHGAAAPPPYADWIFRDFFGLNLEFVQRHRAAGTGSPGR